MRNRSKFNEKSMPRSSVRSRSRVALMLLLLKERAPLQGGLWLFLPGGISRPPPAYLPSTKRQTYSSGKKCLPKITLIFEWLLARQMLPKASQNESKNLWKIIENPLKFRMTFLLGFLWLIWNSLIFEEFHGFQWFCEFGAKCFQCLGNTTGGVLMSRHLAGQCAVCDMGCVSLGFL